MPQSVALFDGSAFFEKTLIYGLQHGVLDESHMAAIQADAPKGMVQIARYFGSEFLRPELEKAKDRIVNMVSLTLAIDSAGELAKAAQALREHSFLSRSKAASDRLKALIVMPQNTHFGMHEPGGFRDSHIPQLAKWTLCSLSDYQAELAKRQQVALVIDTAVWLAEQLGLSADELAEAGCDAEAVIRTALLSLATQRTELPDWAGFQRLVTKLRQSKKALTQPQPKGLPAAFKPVIAAIWQSLEADWPKILDKQLSPQKLFNQTPAFVGRYFWVEDGLNEVDQLDRQISADWAKATGGHSDEGALLTLFLCIAAGSAKKTLLTEKTAATLVRKIRKSGLQPELATQFIANHAPAQHLDDYSTLWRAFIEEAQATLLSDHDRQLHDALSLLRRECHLTD